MTKTISGRRVFGESIRISMLLLLSLGLSMLIFGKRIFESWDYTIVTEHDGTITAKSWFLIAGIFLLITQIFSFLREWYHGFRRESMNYVCLFISLLLLAYILDVYYLADVYSNIQSALRRALADFPSNQLNKTAGQTSTLLLFKAFILVLAIWPLSVSVFFLKKGIHSLRNRNTVS